MAGSSGAGIFPNMKSVNSDNELRSEIHALRELFWESKKKTLIMETFIKRRFGKDALDNVYQQCQNTEGSFNDNNVQNRQPAAKSRTVNKPLRAKTKAKRGSRTVNKPLQAKTKTKRGPTVKGSSTTDRQLRSSNNRSRSKRFAKKRKVAKKIVVVEEDSDEDGSVNPDSEKDSPPDVTNSGLIGITERRTTKPVNFYRDSDSDNLNSFGSNRRRKSTRATTSKESTGPSTKFAGKTSLTKSAKVSVQKKRGRPPKSSNNDPAAVLTLDKTLVNTRQHSRNVCAEVSNAENGIEIVEPRQILSGADESFQSTDTVPLPSPRPFLSRNSSHRTVPIDCPESDYALLNPDQNTQPMSKSFINQNRGEYSVGAVKAEITDDGVEIDSNDGSHTVEENDDIEAQIPSTDPDAAMNVNDDTAKFNLTLVNDDGK